MDVSFDVGVDEDVVGGRHGESDVELGTEMFLFFFLPVTCAAQADTPVDSDTGTFLIASQDTHVDALEHEKGAGFHMAMRHARWADIHVDAHGRFTLQLAIPHIMFHVCTQ